MAGGGKVSISTPRLNGIQVQTSLYGGAIPRGWGTFRVSGNLLWYGDFQAIAQTQKSKSGGKGGGGRVSNTTYSYKASIAMALAAGPIAGVRRVFRDQSVFTGLSGTGLSLASGAIGQAPWGFLTTRYPNEAIGYSGIAYVYAQGYQLTDSAILQNHSFEVQSTIRVSGLDDANPAEIIPDFLSMVPLWGSGLVGDMSDYSQFCLASDYLISPVLDAQVQAGAFLKEILACSNSDCVWSDGKLKIVPLGDKPVSANGTSWEPDLQPVYDLTDDDFLRDGDEDPITYELKRSADAYNYVQIKYRDREHQYNEQTVPGIDQANIDEFGQRKQDPIQLNSICRTSVAAAVAQVLVQNSCNVRKKYRFRLPWNYCLLEPLDLVTITEARLGLSRQLVRIEEIAEDEDGELEMLVEEVLVGVALPAEISRQEPSGYESDFDVDPGDTTPPLMFNPPRQLTGGDLELWLAMSGGAWWGGAEVWVSLDGATYERQGTWRAPARYGTSTSSIPAVDDPDATSVLGVSIALSGGELSSATQPEVDDLATLCLLGGEVIAYRDADLTGQWTYDLAYLRRGLMGTTPSAHASGEPFARLDDAIFRLDYRDDQIGKTLRVKLRSFNVFGQALQELDGLTEYVVTLTPNSAPFVAVDWDHVGNRPVDENGMIDPGQVGPGPDSEFSSLLARLASTEGLLATTVATVESMEGEFEDVFEAAQQAAASAASAAADAADAATASNTAQGAAEAANASAIGAAAANDEAQIAASASVASASTADARATDAEEAASAASAARVAAETARGQAQSAATQAASSRDDAAGSAASASSSALDAADSRDAAAGAASAASGSASLAQTRADEAGLSASAASASQVSASISAGGAKGSASLLFPDRFNASGDFFYRATSSSYGGAPETRGDPTINGGMSILSDATYGYVVRPLAAQPIAAQGVISATDGKIYEITATWKVATAPTSAAELRVYVAGLDASYAWLGNGRGDLPVASGTSGLITHTVRFGRSAPSGGAAWTAAAVWLRPFAYIQTIGGGVFDLVSLSVRDVTSQAAAETSASASATSASNAAASQTAAGQSATAASGSATSASTSAGQALTYRNQASSSASDASDSAASSVAASLTAGTAATTAKANTSLNFPSSFDSAGNFFYRATSGSTYAGSPEVRGNPQNAQAWSVTLDPTFGYVARVPAGESWNILTQGTMDAVPGRVYELTAEWNVRTAPTATGGLLRIYCVNLDADYGYISTGTLAGMNVAVGFTGRVTHTWRWASAAVSGSTNAWASNAAKLRPLFQGNSLSGGGVYELIGVSVREVGATVGAENAAASALTQASNASASAASASISASLAASIGTGAGIVMDPTFNNWPTGQSLPSNCGNPVGVVATRQTTDLIYGDKALRLADTTLAAGYIPIAPGSPASDNTYWVCDYQLTLNSGDLRRVGVQLRNYRAGGGYYVGFFDIAGNHPTSAVGGTYRGSVMVQTTANGTVTGAPTTTQAYFYTNYAGFSGGAFSNKNVTLHMLQMRPATAEEIAAGVALPSLDAQLQVTAAVAADAQTRLSTAVFEVTAAAGGNPAQLKIRADGSSSLASLVAQRISFSTTVSGTVVEVLRLESGRALFSSPISIIQGGRRTTLGPGFGVGSKLHLWSGPSSIAFGSETIDNGILGISATDGFFGGKTYSGPFEDTASTTAITLPTDTWTTVSSFSPKSFYTSGVYMVRYGFSVNVVFNGAPVTRSVAYRIIVSNLNGSSPVTMVSGTYNPSATSAWIGPSALYGDGTINVSASGDKLIQLQLNPSSSGIISGQGRSGYMKGIYGA